MGLLRCLNLYTATPTNINANTHSSPTAKTFLSTEGFSFGFLGLPPMRTAAQQNTRSALDEAPTAVNNMNVNNMDGVASVPIPEGCVVAHILVRHTPPAFDG